MRAPQVVTHEERSAGPRPLDRLTPLALVVLGGALLGASLTVVLGLWADVFESGRSDGDLRAAYHDGLEASGEAGLASAQTQQGADRDAAPTTAHAVGDDTASATLQPQRIPARSSEENAALLCGRNRSLDAGSGLSVHVISAQGWFEAGRVELTAPKLRTADSQANAATADTVRVEVFGLDRPVFEVPRVASP